MYTQDQLKANITLNNLERLICQTKPNYYSK